MGSAWKDAIRSWGRAPAAPKIGLALGGGFARGIAHIGVLRAFERHQIPVFAIAGVSAGAIVSSAFASGVCAGEIGLAGASMRFHDVARWRLSRMGLADSDRMTQFLEKLLKKFRFEDMAIPLSVVATDLATGEPVVFSGTGDVTVPIRASCAYPGLYQPVMHEGRYLVDGAMSMEIPAHPLCRMGAERIISVHLPMKRRAEAPGNMLEVVNRCFQVMQHRTEESWRRYTDLVIAPDVAEMEWDSFASAEKLMDAGERAAMEAMPTIRSWWTDEPAPPPMPRETPVCGLRA